MTNERKIVKPRRSTASSVKRAWHKGGRPGSLRGWATGVENDADNEEVFNKIQDWFWNKTKNFASLPLGIGRTNRVKKAQPKLGGAVSSTKK